MCHAVLWEQAARSQRQGIGFGSDAGAPVGHRQHGLRRQMSPYHVRNRRCCERRCMQ